MIKINKIGITRDRAERTADKSTCYVSKARLRGLSSPKIVPDSRYNGGIVAHVGGLC